MKRYILSLAIILAALVVYAQAPQKIGYQSVIRNSQGKLVQSADVSIRLTILQGSATGTPVYAEVHNTTTNVNGLVSVNIGDGNTTGNISEIDWAAGPYYLQTETDPAGGTNYSVTGVSQLISVPYALYSGGGDYNSLSNKPNLDGSETKLRSGFNINVSGTGTSEDPYVVNYGKDPAATVVITSSQMFTVPANITRMKVELWGGAGGGGGAGTYSYSLLVNGGDGGTGGYASMEMTTSPSAQYAVTIGSGGFPGSNATYYYPYWYGDTDGVDGGDSYFGNIIAAGGKGGKRGSMWKTPVNGEAGMNNSGQITGYAEPSNSNVLSIFQGIERSFIHTRTLTSRSGAGGVLSGYSAKTPKQGEAGCAVITLWEK